MSRCTDQSAIPASFATTAPGVELTVDGNSALIEVTGTPATPVAVTTGLATTLAAPIFYEWTVSSLTAPIALGIAVDPNAELIGTDITNLYYVSTGTIISDGATLRTTTSYGAGDTVSLYIDPNEGKALFFLNGALV